MKFSILVDNNTQHVECCAEWGLSLWIESCGNKILFDTGLSPMFVENAKNMGIDLTEAQALVISHGHFDHTGGTKAFTEVNKNAPIYLHEEALYVTYGETDGVMDDYNCGILWSNDFIKKITPRLRRTSNVVQISSNMWIVGNIPSMDAYTSTEKFFRRIKQDGTNEGYIIVPDEMNHEQLLVVEEGVGKLYVFSGCSHKGVISILEYIKKVFPGKKISALIAGLHFHALSAEKLNYIIAKLAEYNFDMIVPLHCTGIDAEVALKMKFGDRCKLVSAGQSIKIKC